jgi:predicted esterase
MSKTLKLDTYINTSVDVICREGSSNKTIVLLHGFRQTNSWIYKNLQEYIPKEYTIICPNGPYLVPRRNPNLMDRVFAWYFFNNKINKYLVPIEDSVRIVLETIKKFSPINNEIIVVGFSQGGYIAPFIAKELALAKDCIQICARIRTELLKEKYNFNLHAIHGEQDKLVSIDRVKKCFDEFIVYGNKGSFSGLADLDHDITKQVKEKFKSIIENL